MPLEPYLKPHVFSRPSIYNRCNDFILTQTCRNIQMFFSLARTFHYYTYPSRRTHTFSDNMTLYSTLIDIDKRSTVRQTGYLSIKRRSLFFITLGVGYCCFFKVIFSRSSASNAPDLLPPNSFAISTNVASGFSFT